MTETHLQNKVGIFLIISHFVLIIESILLYLAGGFLFEEMTTIIALIIPMFSVYTTAIIKYITSNRIQKKTDKKKVTNEYVFIVFFIPSLFILLLVSILLLKALNIGFSSFENFKIMLVTSETIFGTYVGLVLSSMYKLDIRSKKDTVTNTTEGANPSANRT